MITRMRSAINQETLSLGRAGSLTSTGYCRIHFFIERVARSLYLSPLIPGEKVKTRVLIPSATLTSMAIC